MKQAAIAEEIVKRNFAAYPELARRYGPAGRDKCLQDAKYHLAYLAESMDAGGPALFANYVAWAKVMLCKRGVPAEDLVRHLDLTRTVLIEMLGSDIATVAADYLNAGVSCLPAIPNDLPTYLLADAPHASLAHDYMNALLTGQRHIASQMILAAVAAGAPVKEIYLHVFQPAQYEVGRLWQVNEIGVALEHYCTAATQLIMSQLYPYIFATEKGTGVLVATCVAGDMHEIGVRMVADFFELSGWNTFYLGANTPTQAILETVVQRRAQVLGISATMSFHIQAVGDLIQKVHAHPGCEGVKILVGGHPFLAAPELWRKLGADGCAENAQAAITLANRLMDQRNCA